MRWSYVQDLVSLFTDMKAIHFTHGPMSHFSCLVARWIMRLTNLNVSLLAVKLCSVLTVAPLQSSKLPRSVITYLWVLFVCCVEAGALLVDGLGDGIMISAKNFDLDLIRKTSFGLLQVIVDSIILSYRIAHCWSMKFPNCENANVSRDFLVSIWVNVSQLYPRALEANSRVTSERLTSLVRPYDCNLFVSWH